MVHRLRQRLLVPIQLLVPGAPNLRVAAVLAPLVAAALPWHEPRRFGRMLPTQLRLRLGASFALQLQGWRAHKPAVRID